MKFIKIYGLSIWFYAGDGISFLNLRFENDVKMYGTQAEYLTKDEHTTFENDVKMYGTQAEQTGNDEGSEFENDVKMYGTQAAKSQGAGPAGLRMM